MSTNTNSASRMTSICYFCNESLDGRYLSEHVQHCGAVLEECPEKCGVYVPRHSIRAHRRQCVKRINPDKNVSSANTAYVPPVKNEISWRDNVYAALHLLRCTTVDAERDRMWLRQSLAINSERLDSVNKSLMALKQATVQGLYDARQHSVTIETELTNLDKALTEVDERTCSSFKEVAYRLENLESRFVNEKSVSTKTSADYDKDLKELKTFVAKESAVVGDLWDSQMQRINDLKLELEIRCKISRELENKQDILSEKIDIIVNEIRAHSEEIQKQAGGMKKLKGQIKQVGKILEDLVDKEFDPNIRTVSPCICNQGNFESGATNGRLLWRIDRYKEKMTEAKENDTALYSPIFQNKDYGYALRMELFLNGRGNWKGRHVIGCLRVIEGRWDPLLDWPCLLRATVTLRDQDNPANNIRKIVKTKSRGQDEKNDSLEKDSGLDMFIPHTTLSRYSGFTKHDALFLDIQVTEIRGSLSTSSLVA